MLTPTLTLMGHSIPIDADKKVHGAAGPSSNKRKMLMPDSSLD